MTVMLVTVILLLCITESQYIWYKVNNSADIVTGNSNAINRNNVLDGNANLQSITITFQAYGCGETSSPFWSGIILDAAAQSGSKWAKIKYRQDFWGSTSCWAILGNEKYSQTVKPGLMPFNIATELIEEALIYNWCSCTVNCVGTNFWSSHGSGHMGYLRVEQTRNLSSVTAGLHVGASCSSTIANDGYATYTRYSEIEIGYLTLSPTTNPTNNPTSVPTNNPTSVPTNNPTSAPTNDPTLSPTTNPTMIPSNYPTQSPSMGDAGGVIESTYEQKEEDNDGKTTDESESFMEKNLILLIVCVVGCFVCCVLFFIIRYFKKKKKNLQTNMMDNIELARVTSVSTNSPINTNTNTVISEPETLATKTEKQSEHGVQDAFSNDNALKMWLNNIGLIEYYDIFIENGFGDGTEPILDLNNDDLKDMGISKVAHRKRILKQIENNNQQQMMPLNNHKMMEGGIIYPDTNDVTDVNVRPMMDDSDDEEDSDKMYEKKENEITKGTVVDTHDNDIVTDL